MDPARLRRKEEINRSLAFIQSALAYPDPEGYQEFLTRLVCNLLEEGNALFRDNEWQQAVREFTEALNVSHYAALDNLSIPEALLESLYVNRAAAYHSMGDNERAVKDCDRALQVCKESRRALYRKALCLKELGKHREAYNCTTDCLLINRLDKQVNELAQELAVLLGLKNRKPYVSSKEDALIRRDVSNGNVTAAAIKVPGACLGNGINPLSGLAPVRFPSVPQRAAAPPTAPEVMDTEEDTELMGDDLDNLLDCYPNEQEAAELESGPVITHTQTTLSVPCRTTPSTHKVSPALPPPTPQLPPAFFTSSVSHLNSLDSFSDVRSSSAATLDALDDISPSGLGGVPCGPGAGLDALDGLDTLDDFSDGAEDEFQREEEEEEEEKSLLDDLDPLDAELGGLAAEVPNRRVTAGDQLDALDALDALDSLDAFPSEDNAVAALPALSIGGSGFDSLSEFSSTGIPSPYSAASPVTRSPKNHYKAPKDKNKPAYVALSNPLASTHEFLQACSTCFPRKGKGIYSFVHRPDVVHSCKGDILLCRRKASPPAEWTRVRRLPKQISFKGPFVLCKEVLKSGDLGVCKFGEDCTFAYNQLEIDVWTVERNGRLDRNLLFETSAAAKLDPVSSIERLLQENRGMFTFLCQLCYDSKPRIISGRRKDKPSLCTNLDVHHAFDANRCLVFVRRTQSVYYNKVRPLSLHYQLDLCRQAMRYGCWREDDCYYAHSIIELKTWRVQQDTGIGHDEIVKVSTKYHDNDAENSSKQRGNKQFLPGSGGSKPGGAGKSLNMKMKFVCAQCWCSGLISEPDKTLKYCMARARHAWAKDRSTLLVRSLERSKWVEVRPLPSGKNFPPHYDMCKQILEKRKCNYLGKCTFAHSQEEREMWMYMKNNDLREMQQMYDVWLALHLSRQPDGGSQSQSAAEERSIVMPTDYAEPMSGFHCRLCGKHSNSERQWQQHISSEKHKDRVFSCEGEDEALTWSYRFPGTCFELCPKLAGGCPDGVSCDYAHSPEELQEWTERRQFLRQKLAKAREDMLIMPEEVDFGKFNFLLQD